MDRPDMAKAVRTILARQLFAVLATQEPAGPHTTIVAFTPVDDLNGILFATPRETRKYRNLSGQTAVSLFVDDRRNDPDAISEISGIEARGHARELQGGERETYAALYFARHPILEEFARSAAVFRIGVERYDIVRQFQNVYVLQMDEEAGDGR